MVTILDVIRRSPNRFEYIINNRKTIFSCVKEIIDSNNYNQIVFVGSGSSYSTAVSTSLFVEKASGLETFVMLPNLFIEKSSYNKNALYVFVSQSGTSSMTHVCAKKLTELGYTTIALCGSGKQDSPIATTCKHYIEIGLGVEEYSYATLGFSCTMLTEILLGLETGLANSNLTENAYNEYINELTKVITTNANNIEKTITWIEKHKDKLIKTENFILYGGKSLFGIGNEGALKIMEITKKYVSVGYEMDDGMHGPNYCLDERTTVFALNDGKDDKNAHNIMRLIKSEYKTGYMIGVNTMDEDDLPLDVETTNFTNLEIIVFVQVLAYLLAVENKVDIFQRDDPRINTTKGKGYFNMHEAKK